MSKRISLSFCPGGREIRGATADGEKVSFVFPPADGTLLFGEGVRDEERTFIMPRL